MCHLFVLLGAAVKRDTAVIAGLVWCRDTSTVNFPSNADANISFVCLDCDARADCGKWWRKAYYNEPALDNILPPDYQTACLHIIWSKTIQTSVKFFRQRRTAVWAYKLEIGSLVSKTGAHSNIHNTKCSFTLHTHSQLLIESLEVPAQMKFGGRERTVRRAGPLDADTAQDDVLRVTN